MCVEQTSLKLGRHEESIDFHYQGIGFPNWGWADWGFGSSSDSASASASWQASQNWWRSSSGLTSSGFGQHDVVAHHHQVGINSTMAPHMLVQPAPVSAWSGEPSLRYIYT